MTRWGGVWTGAAKGNQLKDSKFIAISFGSVSFTMINGFSQFAGCRLDDALIWSSPMSIWDYQVLLSNIVQRKWEIDWNDSDKSPMRDWPELSKQPLEIECDAQVDLRMMFACIPRKFSREKDKFFLLLYSFSSLGLMKRRMANDNGQRNKANHLPNSSRCGSSVEHNWILLRFFRSLPNLPGQDRVIKFEIDNR